MKRLLLGICLFGLLLGTVQAKLIGHYPLKPQKPLYIEWDADDADADTWRTGGSSTSGSASVPIITLPDGNKVWEKTAYNALFSSALVPIDPSKSYKLTGTFRSTGSIDSKVYFGFYPILDNGLYGTQTPANSFRKGDDGIMQSWNDTTITLTSSPTGWSAPEVYMSSRLMGFYYDGDTSHAPDFVMYSSAYGATHRGAYISISGATINLSYPLPSNVQDNLTPGTSVVKNHYYGCGSYLYSVISGSILPQTWNTYSDISTGDGWTQTACESFRPFTRYVRIMMLPNYSQDSNSILQFDKIILEEIQGDIPERYTLDPNIPADAAKLNFSVADDGNGKNVWQHAGTTTRESTESIPIDTSKTYRLSGEFRTIGGTPATLYYGARSVSGPGISINATQQNFYGNDATITSYNDSTITTNETLTSWWIPDEPNKSRAGLVFYYNGVTDRLPDYAWSASPNGVYSNATGTTITLREPLPQNIKDQIISGISKVKSSRNGGNSSALLYINASQILPGSTMRPEIPTSWTDIAATITGEVWGSSASAFHKFAKFAKLVVLANESASSATLQIRDLKIETVNDGSHKIIDTAPFHGLAIDSHHHGSNYGATYTTGPNGATRGAMSFDGENDYINLPDNIGYTDNVSAFAWFKKDGDPLGGYHIILGGQELEISITPSGELRTGIYTTSRFVSNHGSGLLDGNWHHLGFTFDGSIKKSFIDGVFVGSQSTTGALTSTFSNRNIGKYGGSNTYYLNGSLADIRIYDHALSQSAITRISTRHDHFTTTAELATRNTNQTGIDKLLYWDITSKEYWIGQFNGSLLAVTASTDTFKSTSDLATIQSGQSATTGQLYWDTDKKKYYIGQPNGTLRPLSE